MARRRRREPAAPKVVTARDVPDEVLLFDLAAWRDAAEAEAPYRLPEHHPGESVPVIAAALHSEHRREWLRRYAPHLTRREVADETRRRRAGLV